MNEERHNMADNICHLAGKVGGTLTIFVTFCPEIKNTFFKLYTPYTLVKSSRIYKGQYAFPILLLNDYNILGEHKGREKNIVYGRLF